MARHREAGQGEGDRGVPDAEGDQHAQDRQGRRGHQVRVRAGSPQVLHLRRGGEGIRRQEGSHRHEARVPLQAHQAGAHQRDGGLHHRHQEEG